MLRGQSSCPDVPVYAYIHLAPAQHADFSSSYYDAGGVRDSLIPKLKSVLTAKGGAPAVIISGIAALMQQIMWQQTAYGQITSMLHG